MLKAALLTVILLSCAGIGKALSNVRRQRLELLEELLTAMRVLRLRMLNSMEPMGILLRKSDSALFRRLGNSLWEGGGISESWRALRERERRKNGALASLSTEDMRILDDFFADLGRSGRDEQNELFSCAIARTEEMQLNAKHVYADASKLYTALGTLIGIGICVLIV